MNRLVAIALDEAHLAMTWGKDFRGAYARIRNIRDRVHHVPMLAVSATLSQRNVLKLSRICGLRTGHTHILRTSVDRPEIFLRIHQLIYPQKQYLDLAALLPLSPKSPYEIEKTLIFVDSVIGIEAILQSMLSWMRTLRYPRGHQGWVKTYFSAMDSRSKEEVANEFAKRDDSGARPGKSDAKPSTIRIVIATTAYGMGINNPDIRRVAIWLAPSTAADWQQRAGRAMRKAKGVGDCILFVSKAQLQHCQKRKARRHTTLSQSQSLYESASNDVSDNLNSSTSDSDYSSIDEDRNPRLGIYTDRSRAQQRGKEKDTKKRLKKTIDSTVTGILVSKECIRMELLAALDDTTYSSADGRTFPSSNSCCSRCHPDERRLLPVPPALLGRPKPNGGQIAYTSFMMRKRLQYWREEQARWSVDLPLQEYPSYIMPDSILDDISTNWYEVSTLQDLQARFWYWPDCIKYGKELEGLITQVTQGRLITPPLWETEWRSRGKRSKPEAPLTVSQIVGEERRRHREGIIKQRSTTSTIAERTVDSTAPISTSSTNSLPPSLPPPPPPHFAGDEPAITTDPYHQTKRKQDASTISPRKDATKRTEYDKVDISVMNLRRTSSRTRKPSKKVQGVD